MPATSFCCYDIPQASKIPNPSPYLRRLGVRINLSCWVFPSDSVPYVLLDSLAQKGAIWHCVPFAETGSKLVAQMAAQMLTKELDELTKRLDQSIEGYAIALAAGDDEAAVLHGRFERQVRIAIKRVTKFLVDAKKGAERIGLDPRQLPILKAAEHAKAVSIAAHGRAAIFARMAGLLQDKTLKLACHVDAVPAYVLADKLEEEGTDSSSLRGEFAETENL